MERLETRELAYFVALAEELHFGRAAQRLGIAQPPLSRAIRQVERRVGVPLIERGSRGIRLTPAGEVLLREGRRALDAVTAASRRAYRAGQPDPRLVLAMKPGGDGGLLPDVLAAYESEADATAVDVLICGVGEQEALLRDGRADAALPRWPGTPSDDGAGPLVRDAGQLMQLIALGRTVAVLPGSVADHLRQDLTCVPVVDAPPTVVVLAWPEQSRARWPASSAPPSRSPRAAGPGAAGMRPPPPAGAEPRRRTGRPFPKILGRMSRNPPWLGLLWEGPDRDRGRTT